MAAVLLYGIWHFVGLWKQRHRREAVVFGLLSAVAACYLLPVIGERIPTTEAFNTWLYRPLSEFVLRKLNIVQEVHPS
ncbi:hypothetical protein JOC55_003251 [Paenibacillus sacheonensis]|nr:hypothetical protein [Paenibacillus sacheonensis]